MESETPKKLEKYIDNNRDTGEIQEEKVCYGTFLLQRK